MKILFLDIDGVLNSFDNQYAMLNSWKLSQENKTRDQYGDLFDERCVRWLEYIVAKTDCKIVISSTWKQSGLLAMQHMWKFRNLPGEVIDVTPDSVDADIIRLHANHEADRGYEIEQWLQENEYDTYCIVDDFTDMLPNQAFVHINSRIGLDYHKSQEIIKTLNHDT